VTLVVLVASLLAVGLWEFCRARRRREFPALRRRLGNLGIWLLNLILVDFIFAPTETFRPELATVLGIGLPAWPITNTLLSFVSGFLVLDLLLYGVHRWMHAVPFLWRFHALHHSDPDVDVTTSVRQHPGEYVLISAAYWITVIVLGIPAIVALSHSLTVFAAAAITHGNIRLPEWLERVLQPVVLTVDLHVIHHSVVYEEANVNFGGVLSIWDRLFGTYADISHARCDRLVFGVRELPRRDCLKPSAMLLTPWRLGRVGAAAEAGD
jgi:sterol desaturase/sphingolipid hydroxylase (fatty acid hydroxylase superfamily)